MVTLIGAVPLPGQLAMQQRLMMQTPNNIPGQHLTGTHKAMTNAMINLSQLQQQVSLGGLNETCFQRFGK